MSKDAFGIIGLLVCLCHPNNFYVVVQGFVVKWEILENILR